MGDAYPILVIFRGRLSEGAFGAVSEGMNGYLALRNRAHQLRSDMTPAEQRVWEALRRRQCAGLRFRRQEALGQYIADFYCPTARIVLEIDGGIHDSAEAEARDVIRTATLAEARGLRVIRLRNETVLSWTHGQIRQRVLAAIQGKV